MHIIECIEWYSRPRLYWTFPQESINGVLKRIAQRESNHRSVCWTLARHYLLLCLLTMVTRSGTDLPVPNQITCGTGLVPAEYTQLLINNHIFTDQHAWYATAGGSLIINYQKVVAGVLIALDTNSGPEYALTKAVIVVPSADGENDAYVIYHKLNISGIDTVTGLKNWYTRSTRFTVLLSPFNKSSQLLLQECPEFVHYYRRRKTNMQKIVSAAERACTRPRIVICQR